MRHSQANEKRLGSPIVPLLARRIGTGTQWRWPDIERPTSLESVPAVSHYYTIPEPSAALLGALGALGLLRRRRY
jgi:hypothetical protein